MLKVLEGAGSTPTGIFTAVGHYLSPSLCHASLERFTFSALGLYVADRMDKSTWAVFFTAVTNLPDL